MTSLPCDMCHATAGSFRALRDHIIGHGAAAVARHIGRPDLAAVGSWGYVLKLAVKAMARRAVEAHG